jgi:translation initiation factor IF-2
VGRARAFARQHGVNISLHEIIYDLADEAQRAMARVLGPRWVERQLGSAEIRQVFRAGTTRAAGCRVVEGVVRRGAQVRILRGEAEVGRGSVESLRRIREDAREVREGLECGVVVNGFEAFEVGDRLAVFELEEERLQLRAS